MIICIYTAFMWRFSSVVEIKPWDDIFAFLFMSSPIALPILTLVFVNYGVKAGVVDVRHLFREYYIDNVMCAVVLVVILLLMGNFEIIVIQSGGDFSGIEFFLYLIGMVAVEAVIFSIGFIIQAIACFKKKEYFQMVVLLILSIFLIERVVLQVFARFIF